VLLTSLLIACKMEKIQNIQNNPETTISFNRIKNSLLALLAIGVGMIYVYYWRFGYNADYAMIGLLAKRILETGEQFIFVPIVGYQGLLYEGNLVALMFRLFGVSPAVLNFGPFLTYLIFLFVFNKAVKAWNGDFVANIATLFVILSPPQFSRVVIRTQPNYGETFLLGSALIWIYRSILNEIYQRKEAFYQAHNQKHVKAVTSVYGLFGLVAGFGMYTYGQIAYFIGAVLMHASFYLTLDYRTWSRSEDSRALHYNRVLKFLFAYGALGLVFFLTDTDQIHILGKKISWLPYAILEFAVVGSIAVIWIAECRRYWAFVKSYAFQFFCMIGAFFVGYFPKIYYNLILKIPSTAGGLGRGGDFSEIAMRAKFLILGQMNLLGNPYSVVMTGAAAALVLTFLLSYLFSLTERGLSSFRVTQPSAMDLAKLTLFSPFFFLIWMVVFSYLSSTSVTDIHSARYTLVLFLPYGVAIGYVLNTCLKNKTYRPFLKAAVPAALIALLALNIKSLSANIIHSDKPDLLENIATYLTDKDVHFGYGFYWYTYPINLLTQENIILDPLGSNYTPYYREKVLAADRIAYVDKQPYTLEAFNGDLGVLPSKKLVTIFGNDYLILEKQVFKTDEQVSDSIAVFLLEKMNSLDKLGKT
jgi:cytochrome bd-type quinol oxidase subunit 2